MVTPCAFTGSADEGPALPNIERAKKLQRPGRTEPGPGVYLTLFWRGPEAEQLLLIQSFPVLEVVIKVLHEVRQVNKGWREKQGRGVCSLLYERFRLPHFLSGIGTWAFCHRALPWPSILKGTKGSQPTPSAGVALQHLPRGAGDILRLLFWVPTLWSGYFLSILKV